MSQPTNVTPLNPTITVSQGLYEESTTKQMGLGTRLQVGERVFYYAKLSTAASVVAGNVLAAPLAVTTAMGCTIAVDTSALGKQFLTITAGTALVANQFADGYVIIASSGLAGGGLMFKVKSHAAISSGASGVLNLFDDIPAATVAAGPGNIINSLYDGVAVGSQVLSIPVGVAPVNVTSGNYFWLQTWGLAAPIHTAATAVAVDLAMGTLGTVVALRTGTEGGGATVKSIGKNINLAATANFTNPVYLTITP